MFYVHFSVTLLFHKKSQLSFAKGGTWTNIQYNVSSTLKYNDIHRLLQETSLPFPVFSINLNPETEKISFLKERSNMYLVRSMPKIKIKVI